MNNVTLFATTTITTTVICAAMHLTAEDAQRLAVSKQPILVNGAETTGLLETRGDGGIYGVINITNRTDETVSAQLNHATFCTPASSRMMRMIPRPKQKHEGTCTFELKPGEGTQIEFCVQEPAVAKAETPAAADSPPIVNQLNMQMTPAQWSLIISHGAIQQPGFGGLLTMPQGNVVLPQEGQIVLAHTAAAAKPTEQLAEAKL